MGCLFFEAFKDNQASVYFRENGLFPSGKMSRRAWDPDEEKGEGAPTATSGTKGRNFRPMTWC